MWSVSVELHWHAAERFCHANFIPCDLNGQLFGPLAQNSLAESCGFCRDGFAIDLNLAQPGGRRCVLRAH